MRLKGEMSTVQIHTAFFLSPDSLCISRSLEFHRGWLPRCHDTKEIRHTLSATETHITKPMTDDASHPPSAANFCLFASPSPSINGPGVFLKTEETIGKEMFSRSRILFPYPRAFSIYLLLLLFKGRRRCWQGKGSVLSRPEKSRVT